MLVKFLNIFLITGTSLLLTSCAGRHLDVQTRYITREDLASYFINSPDPKLDHPDIGQRLLIQWVLPRDYAHYSNLTLFLTVRLRNHQEQTLTFPIQKRRGTYTYDLLNQEYETSGGILTYKVEIRTEDCVLDQWKHPLWAEWITFDPPKN